MKRSLVFCAEARAHGMPCIPSLSWMFQQDRERWVEWLRRQQDRVDCLGLNAQSAGRELRHDLAWAREIEQRTGRAYEWVILGPCREPSVTEVYRAIDPARVTIVTAAAEVDAVFGKTQGRRHGGPRDPSLRAAANYEEQLQLLERCRSVADRGRPAFSLATA
jgi:hypothetical protein